ncbi:hypothetical protein DPMN_040466 [Dreissena polymorpha]|uniref:Uncharacterized protein n=1 Tax=Dreissena polymorpha TaxID=45954 RepID=A0A9D4CVC9_DREPO|nr:hypothetical protein DPMN_040466 [Dreissena polymorpha]
MGMPVSKHINVKDPSIIRTNTERGSQVIRSPQLNGQSTFDSTYKEGDDVEDTEKSFKSISCNQGDTRDHITQNTDVNNMNTKFNILSYGTHHYSSFKLSNDVKADNSPVLACAFSDRTTRITSANYNPHVVVKDAHIQDVHDTDNRDNAIKKGIDHIYEEGAEQTERSVEPDMCLQEESSFNNEQLHTFIVSSELHSETKLQRKV